MPASGRSARTAPIPPIRDTDDLVAALGVRYTDEQLAAITAPLQPAVIVAGAGSGKTTVMAARVVWLVGTGAVPAAEVLGLTFTNKAAGELGQRVRAALARAGIGVAPGPAVAGARESRNRPTDPAGHGGGQDDPGEPTIATYHAYAGNLIAEHGLRLGVEPHARLLADPTRYQLAARAIAGAPGPYPTLTKSLPMLVTDVLALAGEVAEHLVALEDLRAHDQGLFPRLAALPGADSPTSKIGEVLAAAGKRLALAELVAAYTAAKQEVDAVDFGDQMALAARLAEECPEVGQVERARYRVVLLDEYQDTSVAQRRMLVGLFGGGHPVTAVGDPCQAIYGWRGASVANLENFPTDFRATRPGGSIEPARRYTLRENRRSGELILDLANALAAPLRVIHDGVAPLAACGENLGAGQVRTAVLATWPEELSWVGDQVAAALTEGVPAGEVAVLVRATRDIGPLHAELTGRDIPVQVVGLGGLVHLPEVADVIAVLEVLDDPCANAALVRLLVGPRWRIGARDLALLGRRAAALVKVERSGVSGPDLRAPGAALAVAAGVTDPAELLSLSDALADLGRHGYSAAARDRFAALDAELRGLRRHLGEPLLDLLHRVISQTGLDVEIAAGPHEVAARRRESLAAFLDAAAGFVDLDGESSVAAFLAYLRAAEEHERGLDSATPAAADAVTLMTAHKAKGLEWDVVVLPDMTATVFPSNRGRARWTTRAETLPHPLRGDRDDLPGVGEWSPKGLKAFEAGMREQSEREELRLGYVACTRPRKRLVASAHWWGLTQKKPRGPSPYLQAMREFSTERGLAPGGPWAPPPPDGASNPLRGLTADIAWPAVPDERALVARRAAADLVERARSARATTRSVRQTGRHSGRLPGRNEGSAGGARPVPEGLSSADAARVAGWDADLDLLLAEVEAARPEAQEVALPASLSASQVLALARDPDALAGELARPMPRPPAPAARRGTRFHAWVESLFGQQPLLAEAELSGAADDDLLADPDLDELRAAFLRSRYGPLPPHAVEAPFALALAGRVIRGRIDAVYATLTGFEVVDWKTGARGTGDPVQLAIYRLAWAEIAGVEVAAVDAAFLYVRSGKVERPPLPDRAELERLLSGTDGSA